jgi:hypothetical protein
MTKAAAAKPRVVKATKPKATKPVTKKAVVPSKLILVIKIK